MAVHDTIGDFLTIIRNGSSARKNVCITQYSKMRIAIAAILKKEGYLRDFIEGKDARGFKTIELNLKFVGNTPAITGIERYSKPGCRLYCSATEIPRVLGGLGVAILTTSKGVVRARDAREFGVGGEVLCKVW